MKLYIDVFILGLGLGWGPCFSFCAPILLPYIGATQKGWFKGLKISVVFSLARVIAYVVLSLISAGLGSYLIRRFYEQQAGLIISVIAAGFILLLGIIILMGGSGALHFCAPIKRFAGEGAMEMALLGLIVGFAPCLPLFGLLAYIAFNAQSLLQGVLLGLAFGLGTLISPLILLGPVAGQTADILFKRPLIYKIFNRICGLILLYLGIGMIIRILQ